MSAGLTARGLVRGFGGIRAVDGVDLAAPPGRITALVGPNGAGKSTLFDCLAGAARPDAGRVLLAGRDITRLPDHARARLGLARTFQQVAAFPGLTVAQNVRVGAEQGRGGAARALPGLPAPGRAAARSAARAATDRALHLLDLDPVRDWPADRLPPGALRLLELARALAAAPRVLLLDEPAAGLDLAQTARLAAVLRALTAEGMALLLVEHDVELVSRLADTVYVMAAGRVVARGPTREVLADPRVAAAWGEP
ncbi:ABC transporter ATP-binding protein [Kitasatospora herbaricolor]|uniref:ABC transporter ATP-binding protein n=1 Tax=Kitasatospora herbaricolor TaxID=68217 RepID=UPI0019BC0652|nr:ATP-binding cassette domain-containing protein [Kitasatospora herbaricolor]MDQ0312993.1 branched-chain amino acid transport system ATP-binding protein [Kitasatospora herbaricolor]GGV24885.1 ABC transporter ATP-binding protein [Kitasatospora herbaricolor]